MTRISAPATVQLVSLGNCDWSYSLTHQENEGQWFWRCERLHPDASLPYEAEDQARYGAVRAILATVLAMANPAAKSAVYATDSVDANEDEVADIAKHVAWLLGCTPGATPLPVPEGAENMSAAVFSHVIYQRVLARQHPDDRAHYARP